MQIIAEVNIDEIIDEVVESQALDRQINDVVEAAVTDAIEDALSRLDIDEVNDFERRAEEIAREVAQDVIDGQDPNGATFANDKVDALESRVNALQTQVDALTEALQAAAILLRGVVKG